MVAVPAREQLRLRCCGATGCRSAGAEPLLAALRTAAGAVGPGDAEGGAVGDAVGVAVGVAVDGAVPEPLEVRTVGCLRLCGAGPLVALDGPGGTSLYGGVPPERAGELVALARASGRSPAAAGPGIGGPDLGGSGLACHRLDLEHPFFRLQRPLVLEGCGIVDPERIEDALAQGSYAQLRRVLQQLSPAEVREQVRRSGLRGRGGGGYPTGLKWDTVALQPPGRRYVVCNADEGDPGAFMDRSVLEGDPHRLLEGMAIAAYAVGADHGYVYVRAEYPLAIERLRRALQQAHQLGLLGRGIAGSDFNLELEVRVGAGAYVCGEETALLHSIEGLRGMPRSRPPFPAQAGLWGSPTLINNVETFAAVPVILREGGDWYAAIGSEGSRGTKVFSLSGAIRHTGLVEVPMGISLRTVVETMGGGDPDGGAVKAVQTGGPSGGCIPHALLDTPVDFESLLALGSMMGSGGMVVIGQGTTMPEVARHFMAFSVNESCGKCVPCRAGTVQLLALLDRVVQHQATAVELEALESLCAMVKATSLCGLGQAAPNPVLSTLRHFRHEYTGSPQVEP